MKAKVLKKEDSNAILDNDYISQMLEKEKKQRQEEEERMRLDRLEQELSPTIAHVPPKKRRTLKKVRDIPKICASPKGIYFIAQIDFVKFRPEK